VLRRQLPVYSPVSLRALLSVSGRGAELERRVTDLLRKEYDAEAVRVYGSGTEALQAAIQLAVAAAGEQTPVALPAFSCFDVATAAVGAGRPIVLYDVEPGTLGPALASLERALMAGVRVVVVAPLYGVPVHWKELETALARYGAVAIEDAAQGHGASWCGRKLGSLGILSVLSFGRGKGWTAGAGGALLVRRNPEFVAKALSGFRVRSRPKPARELAVWASAAMQWAFSDPAFYRLPASIPWLGLGETHYRDPRAPGMMTGAGLGVLLAGVEKAAREAEVRRRNAEELRAGLPDREGVRAVRPPPGSRPGYLRLPVRLSAGMPGFGSQAEALRAGIAPSYPTPLAALPAVRERLAALAHCAGAEELAAKLVTLPVHSRMSHKDREKVLRLLNTYGP
jgi:dTDP-4-amino-4,6-dideoxygalactose transaminase